MAFSEETKDMVQTKMNKINKQLHWTTVISEKFMLGIIGCLTIVAAGFEVYEMFLARKIELADLFLLFIYTEIIGMVGSFYASSRIPVTLPIIIAITALKIGIRCKKTPERLAPIKDIPFIQRRKDAKPGNSTTYDKIKINGKSKLILNPT